MRTVLIALGSGGAAAAEEGKDIYSGLTAAEALGKWVFHHRKELGLEIELVTPQGRIKAT